jgi:hypothetical protein
MLSSLAFDDLWNDDDGAESAKPNFPILQFYFSNSSCGSHDLVTCTYSDESDPPGTSGVLMHQDQVLPDSFTTMKVLCERTIGIATKAKD